MPFRYYFAVFMYIAIPQTFAKDLNLFKCDFNDMTAFYLEELGVEDVHIEYIIKRVGDHRTRGFAQKIGRHSYRITLADWLEDSEMRVTTAHELVHVRQLERGEIDRSEFEKHYHNRSFEDEAFRLSYPMAINFYTNHKCNE